MPELSAALARAASPEPSSEANLAALVEQSQAAERPALTFEQRTITADAVIDRAGRVAALLRRRGVGPGDRVALQVPNVPAFAFLYYGILRAGAIVVPMNPVLREREVAYTVQHSGAETLVRYTPAIADDAPPGEVALLDVDDPWMEWLAGEPADASIAPVADEDTAVILYTSGTTGRPKGAELTHRGLRLNTIATCDFYGLAPGQTVLGILPLYHSYGQTCVLNAALSAGALVVLQARFDGTDAVRLIEQHAVDIVAGVPTMFQSMLQAAGDGAGLRSVRLCQTGGAAMPLATLHAAERCFGCPVVEGYGLTETSPVATINMAQPRPPGSIGTAIPGVELAIVDERGAQLPADDVGEVVIRGHNVMKGYWRDAEATARAIDGDGWFHSGDLGRRDEDGFFYIVGRIKDMINRGGMNVYPREIEEVLHEHPDVVEAAVVAIADERLGEDVGAALQLTPNASGDLEAIRRFVAEHVAPYKCPRLLWTVLELPKGPTGKILKREIRVPDRDAG